MRAWQSVKLNHFRYAVAVAERGSLHGAARQLRVAQPALTRSIHELERELNVPLFERRSSGMIPTEMGEIFIRGARAVLQEIDRATAEISQISGGTYGRVSACLGVLAHITLLPNAMEAFRLRYPEVFLDILEGRFPNVEASLRNGLLDCFVGPAPPDPRGKDLHVEPLYEQETAILCRKGHPLTGATSLRDLGGAQWLSNSVTVDPEEELGPLFARHGLTASTVVSAVALRADDSHHCRTLGSAGAAAGGTGEVRTRRRPAAPASCS